MTPLIRWMIGSSAFRKSSGMVSAFALGVWLQASYWKQIIAVLAALGIPYDDWTSGLAAVAFAGGAVFSTVLTLANQKKVAELKAIVAANPPPAATPPPD